MKRLTTILMLVLIGYNSIGFYFVFKFKHQKAELEFNEYINSGSYSDADLTLFKVSVQEYSDGHVIDFNRVEGDFKHNGKFYEIVRESVQNDTVYVYCLNNEKEEQLYASLAEHIDNHISDSKSSKSKNTKKAFRELAGEYLSKETLQVSFVAKYILVKTYYPTVRADLLSLKPTIPTPPPQLIS